MASAATLAGIAASDNFNRADGGLGVNWAKPVPASEQTLVIVNNEVTPDIENGHCYAYWIGSTSVRFRYFPGADQQCWGRGTGSLPERSPESTDSIWPFVFGANDYRLYLRKDGLCFSPSAQAVQETWLPGDFIRLDATGSNPGPLDVAAKRQSGFDLHTDATENLVGGSPGLGFIRRLGRTSQWTTGRVGSGELSGPTWDLWSLDTQTPKVPGNIVATALEVSRMKLSWTALTDNAGVTKSEVQRQDPGSTSFVHVTTTTGTNYTDAGLAEGSRSSYRVLVRDAQRGG